MKVDKFRLFIFFLVGVVIVSWTVRSKRILTITGETMGTSYVVKAYASLYLPEMLLRSAIEKELALVSDEMSTYDPLSDISKLNDTGKTKVGPRFKAVFGISKKVYLETGGAFNPAIKPLLEIWGIGTESGFKYPEKSTVESALGVIRLDQFKLKEADTFVRTHPEAKLDFSAIAKGYGVDRLSDVLKAYNVSMAFIEIGGEVRVLGSKPMEQPWKLGLQDPSGGYGELYGVVSLRDLAMATSGDYRQYFEYEGVRYSHILDPRTGYPIRHRIASVTVIAPTCVEADAYATGFMVMQPEDVLEVANRLSGVEVLILQRDSDDRYTELKTDGFTYTKLSN